MDRAYESNQGAAAPAPPNPPILGYPSETAPATVPGAWWFHMITEELRAAIIAAGIVPDGTKVNQLAGAMKTGATANSIALRDANGGLTATYIILDEQTEVIQGPNGTGINLNFSDGYSYYNAQTGIALRIAGGANTILQLNASNATLSVPLDLISDARLKKNIRPIANARERMKKIRGVLFEWDNESGDSDAGVLAQEAIDALPESVRGEKVMRVRPMALLGLLVATVNELIAELESRP